MKKYLCMMAAIFLALGISSCADKSETPEDSTKVPMSIQVTNELTTRAPIYDASLPNNASIGVTLVNDSNENAYDNVGTYANNEWTLSGSSWSTAPVPMLSGTEGKAVAYYPYDADCDDYEAIPVESATQTDYMYSGWSNVVNNADPQANFVMKHALALVRINLKIAANYTGDSVASEVSISSNSFMAAADLDAVTGVLDNKTGAGAEHTKTGLNLTLNTAGTNVDFLVIPADGALQPITCEATIGGKNYTAQFTPSTLAQGKIHTYTLTLSPVAMQLASVSVTTWTTGDTGEAEFSPAAAVLDKNRSVHLKFVVNNSSQKVIASALQQGAMIEVWKEDAFVAKGDYTFTNYVFPDNGEYDVYVQLADPTVIPANSFANTEATEAIIPDCVTTIGRCAFAYSTINTITFGTGVDNLGSALFEGSSYIKNIKFLSNTPPTNYDTEPMGAVEIDGDCKLYVPAGCTDDYNAIYQAIILDADEANWSIVEFSAFPQ